MENLIVIITGFILGGVPFGYIFTKAAGLGDIRDIGSGNIGATNVLRTGNKKLAALTLFADAMKGYLIVIIPPLLIQSMTIPSEKLAFIGVIGHIFSVFLKFKGGKGVATALGGLLAINPFLGLGVLFVWLLCAKLFKISSLSALIACAASPIIGYALNTIMGYDLNIVSLLGISFVIFYSHIDNIKRLLSGEETAIKNAQ